MLKFEETKKLLHNSSIYYLLMVDMNSNYAYINKRYQDVFYAVHGNLTGKNYAITMHADDLQICSTVAEKCFKEPEKVFPALIRKHNGKGGYVFTQWEYKAVFDAQGQPAGVFCIGHDITEFMNTSVELKDTAASLDESRLTLRQIAYVQSHIVRKPIANILGLILLLETTEMDNEAKSIFDKITKCAEELDEVIRNMAGKM